MEKHMQVLQRAGQKTTQEREGRTVLLWNGLFSVLLMWWSLSVLRAPWGSLAPSMIPAVLTALLVYHLCLAAYAAKKTWLKVLFYVIPWIVLLPFLPEIRRGLLLWINCNLSLWNQLHRDGLVLYEANATSFSVMAVSLAAAVLVGQLLFQGTVRRHRWIPWIGGLLLLLLQLLTDTFLPLSWALWLSALLGLFMSRRIGQNMAPQTVLIWLICTVLLLVAALPGAEAKIPSVTEFRQNTKRSVHDMRYGSDPFPQGKLKEAASLNQGEEELLQVQTEQEKALYLRAYVGAEYEDGVWSALPGETYGGEYSGMLKWLKQQGFDPLTQPAAYYALCGTENAPVRNRVQVQVTGGTSAYIYAPISAASVSASYKDKKDLAMKPSRFFGAKSYLIEESSFSRPSELTVRADWVTDPQTEAQKTYVQAEEMYRSFVHDTYTQTDAALQPLLDSMFWEDYDSEDDSLYSAVAHIRNVLEAQTSYAKEPEVSEDGTDPIREFLTGNKSGNAMLYASASVEALRAKGIPARYVEGYYLSASAIAAGDGTVSLSGQDAHAWVEVYFDGIGWLPVDMTPGYYYDAITLRQMISLPDSVKKTAALSDETDGGEDLSSMDSDKSGSKPPVKVVIDTLLLALGIAAIVILALTLWYLIRRLTGMISDSMKRRRYLRADAAERTKLLEAWIFGALSAAGLDASLGWNIDETDAAVTAGFSAVKPGEYARATALLEKSVYGGITLEPYELRVLQAFLEKIAGSAKKPKATGGTA